MNRLAELTPVQLWILRLLGGGRDWYDAEFLRSASDGALRSIGGVHATVRTLVRWGLVQRVLREMGLGKRIAYRLTPLGREFLAEVDKTEG